MPIRRRPGPASCAGSRQETGDVLIDLAKCPAFCAENEAVMQPNDGLHFSAVGYELLAQNVEAVLRDHLKCD